MSKESKDESSRVILDKKFELIAEGLQKDQAKIFVMHLAGSNKKISLPGVSKGYHYLSHHRKDPDKMKQLAIIESNNLQAVAGFLKDLKKKDLLKDTSVLLSSALGDANKHSNKKLPVILFGGGFAHKKEIKCIRKGELVYSLSKLHNSILKQVGLKPKNIAGENGIVEELFA